MRHRTFWTRTPLDQVHDDTWGARRLPSPRPYLERYLLALLCLTATLLLAVVLW